MQANISLLKTHSAKQHGQDELHQVLARDALTQYVDASSQEVFPLLELERVYLSSLNASEIERESHITRFAKTVNETECGVVPLQKDENNQHFAVKE